MPLLKSLLLLGEALDPFGVGADDDVVPVLGQQLAQERGIPVYQPTKMRDGTVAAQLQALIEQQ